MSDWRKMAEDFFLNAVTLGGYGAGQAIGAAARAAQGSSGGHRGPAIGGFLGQGGISGLANFPGMGGLLQGTGVIQPPQGARPKQPASDCDGVAPPPSTSTAAPACCNRFTFAGGYLLDGATGDLWKLDSRGDALQAVPRNRSKLEQALREKMAERDLKSIAAAYADEALVGLPAAVKARQLKAFDKSILEPMRAVVRGG